MDGTHLQRLKQIQPGYSENEIQQRNKKAKEEIEMLLNNEKTESYILKHACKELVNYKEEYVFKKIPYKEKNSINIIETCQKAIDLDKNDFNGLILDNKWNKEISSSSDMFSLVVDEIFDLEENPKSTESIIKNLIKKNIEVQVSKIALYGNFTTGKLIEKIIEMFAKKSIKLSNENIEDIKSFISQNFKNSKGKNLGYKEIKNKSFFNEHLKFIKSILIDCIKKGNIKCTEKDIARIIHKSLPELGELKTIENY